MFKKNLINKLLITLLLALAIGFFVSRAMVSIAMIAIFVLAVYYQLNHKITLYKGINAKTFFVFAGFYFLILTCSLFSGQINCFTEPLIAFAPLLILPFAFQVFEFKIQFLKRWLNTINWIFIGGTFFVLMDMVYRQGFNSEKIIQLAHDSKNVSNIWGIHHNIVGFLAVYAIFYIAELLKRNRQPLLFLLLFLIVAIIHHLGLRFAIMAFYPLMLIYLLRLQIKRSTKIYSLLIGCFLLVGSFMFIPAFKARYQNTKSDIENVVTNRNPNFFSLNQRLIANQIGFDIAKKNWLFGVGTCEIKQLVEQEYARNSRLLIPENRKFIHNQLIYGWATYGFFYVLGWLILFGFLIYKGIKDRSILLEISLLFLMHQMVENTLEKQLMLMLLIYFTFLMPRGLESRKLKV
ncbi:MAG TPA: O-antigen ligase family protein [Pelobium sp.]|nr:O-antigen ligase family protein [Pelobium sp.]